MQIQLTEKAAHKMKSILAEERQDDLKIRIGVQGGGCSGLSYFMTIEKNITERDKVLEQHGVQLCVDAKSAMYLEGIELDFTDGLNGSGFVFNNPNAMRTCGCGSSFSV